MSPAEDACGVDFDGLDIIFKNISTGIVRRNMVMFVSLIIAAVLVGAGSFSRRYWRHGSIRLLFLGAYILLLPLVSYVISGVDKENYTLPDGIVGCSDNGAVHLLMWASLVQIVGSNYCTAIATHDDEPRNIGPTVQLLLGAIWTLFLVVKDFRGYSYASTIFYWLIAMPCALSLAKILTKLYAYENSRRSFEVGGRNTRLIAGYMEQFNLQREGDEHPIPLILMGEDKLKVEEGPRGYRFTDDSADSSSLVTMYTVANIVSTNDNVNMKLGLPFEDLCLSFSLFKLLRQRFTKYPVVEADRYRIPNFMIKLRQSEDAERIVRMIEYELSFACDFYYSYLPITYSSWWLPILNVVLSFFVITYCSAAQIFLVQMGYSGWEFACESSCGVQYGDGHRGYFIIINVLTSFLAIAVLLSEAWENIISYTSSNWTKVNLIYYYMTKTSRQGSPLMKRLIRCMLWIRCKALNHSYKMGQTSIMDTNMKIVKAVRRLLQLSDQKMEYVEIEPKVNTAILDRFRANWSLPTATETLQQNPIGNHILWACNGKGTSDIILVWHIATCIFEIKHPFDGHSNAPAVTASQLSRYCAYLLSSAPELLPDDKAWSKKLYESVKKITEPIFTSRSNVRPMQYDRILPLLDEKCSSNTELKNGVKLGKQLVEETQGAEQEGWKVLAGFWSAMVLYIAPSDNVGAHREAIARGGELITILWAMLTHAGIISRPRTGDAV